MLSGDLVAALNASLLNLQNYKGNFFSTFCPIVPPFLFCLEATHSELKSKLLR
jgi:hypothetical protein